METTQKPQEETFRIHDQAEARRHVRREDPSDEQRKGSPVKTQQNRRSNSAEKKRKPEKKATGKVAPTKKAGLRKTAEGKSPTRKKTADSKAVRKPDPEDISEKKRVYGKTKPKKKSVARLSDKLKKKHTAKKSSRPKQPTPAVIYTQPQAFNRNRLLVQLLTVVAVVAALVLGLSVFFKVETIQVSGAEVYSEWTIREASGLKDGDNLLTFSHARSAALIKANLPYVDTVRFGIKLPDTVNIIVKEDEVVYAVKDQNGQWWLMNGRLPWKLHPWNPCRKGRRFLSSLPPEPSV